MIQESLFEIHKTLTRLRPQLLDAHGSISHTKKSDSTSLTELDILVEKELIRDIKKKDRQVGFYGEEFGQQGSKDRFWTIDPIDGTEAFIRGLPFCTNMLAYIENGEVLASVIYNFTLDKYYQAILGSGATCNDMPIKVSNRDISHACVEFEIRQDVVANRDIYFDIPRFSFVKFSAAGFGFCQVASGCTEARISYDAYGKIWDYAPGSLLVAEAGGIVTNIGKPVYSYENTNIIASNKVVHNDLQNYFNQKLLMTVLD
jgi:myo-inositol-1(or 4)-monophosphatase